MNIDKRYDQYLPAAVFAVAFLGLLPFFRHKIVSDMVSYLTISKHIADGQFFESVNAYWSPFISWLVAPFLLLGIEGLLATKILNLLAGIVVLVQLHKLTCAYTTIRWQQLLIPFLCIHHLLYFALCNATPDIISLACWFVFFNQLRTSFHHPTFAKATLIGLLGACCYVAKYYNFYAVTGFLALAAAILLASKKNYLFPYLIVSAAVFALLSFVWIFILHSKFGVWAPTTASTFNMNLIRPGGFMHPMQVGDRILPIDYNLFSITSWEYPLMYPIPAWSPLNDLESLRYHFTVHVRDNILHFRNKHVAEFCLFGLSCLFAMVNRKKYSLAEWLLLVSILLYPIGYFWLIALSRYALFSMFVALLWIVLSASKVKKFQIAVWIIIGMGMVYSHIISFNRIKNYPDKGANYANYYQEVTQKTPFAKHRILSSPSCWAPALYFSYYSQSKLYDVLKPELLQTNLTLMKSMQIEYYFCKRNEVPDWLTNQIVFEGEWVLVALP
jgi:hypothetical protein